MSEETKQTIYFVISLLLCLCVLPWILAVML